MSGRLNTRGKQGIKYGRVEVCPLSLIFYPAHFVPGPRETAPGRLVVARYLDASPGQQFNHQC